MLNWSLQEVTLDFLFRTFLQLLDLNHLFTEPWPRLNIRSETTSKTEKSFKARDRLSDIEEELIKVFMECIIQAAGTFLLRLDLKI